MTINIDFIVFASNFFCVQVTVFNIDNYMRMRLFEGVHLAFFTALVNYSNMHLRSFNEVAVLMVGDPHHILTFSFTFYITSSNLLPKLVSIRKLSYWFWEIDNIDWTCKGRTYYYKNTALSNDSCFTNWC